MQYLNAGLTAGYVDLDQIGFISPARPDDPGNHRLKAGNLAAIWRNYHAAGATHLIAAGPIESNAALQPYIDAFPRATMAADSMLLDDRGVPPSGASVTVAE
jgi:hypothetical protein